MKISPCLLKDHQCFTDAIVMSSGPVTLAQTQGRRVNWNSNLVSQQTPSAVSVTRLEQPLASNVVSQRHIRDEGSHQPLENVQPAWNHVDEYTKATVRALGSARTPESHDELNRVWTEFETERTRTARTARNFAPSRIPAQYTNLQQIPQIPQTKPKDASFMQRFRNMWK